MRKKIVLLTGSTGRLGRIFSEKYCDDYYIIGVARNENANFTHEFIQGDITVDAKSIVNNVLSRHGRIDVLINNAASYEIKPLDELDPEQLVQVYRTNVVAPHELARKILDKFWQNHFEKNKSLGRNIINVSSVSATNVYPGQGAYAASKAALNMLSRHMAMEYSQHGLRVNVLAPTSFPAIISCETVADALVNLERSRRNGEVVEVV